MCVPKPKDLVYSFEGGGDIAFHEAAFEAWIKDTRESGLEFLKEDDHFVDCAAARFQESLVQQHAVESHTPLRHSTNKGEENRKEKRPTIIIHVGPRKTGSTAIQQAMFNKYQEELLHNENFVVVEKYHHLITKCLLYYERPYRWLQRCDDTGPRHCWRF